MSNEYPRCVRIAKALMSGKDVVVPMRVFNDVVSQLTSQDGVNLVSKRPNRGCCEVNGLMRDIRKVVKSLRRKYRGEFQIDLDNKSANERKRCLIVIRPVLPSIPQKAKVQFKNGVAHFVDGPFRGEEVIWSSRTEDEEIPVENEIGEDIFVVEPDRYRATFYGWKKKY